MTNDRRKSWYVVVRHHAKVPTTSYIEWQPNSGIKCIFQQLSGTSTYSTKYLEFCSKTDLRCRQSSTNEISTNKISVNVVFKKANFLIFTNFDYSKKGSVKNKVIKVNKQGLIVNDCKQREKWFKNGQYIL